MSTAERKEDGSHTTSSLLQRVQTLHVVGHCEQLLLVAICFNHKILWREWFAIGFSIAGPVIRRYPLTRDHLGGVGSAPLPPRFFLNNVRSDIDINAKLGVPFRTSIWRPCTKFWKIFVITFWILPILVTQCHAIFGRKSINVWKITENRFLK